MLAPASRIALAVETIVLAGPSIALLGYVSLLILGITASSVVAWAVQPSAFATVPEIPLIALGAALAFVAVLGLAALTNLLGALGPALVARSFDRTTVRRRLARAFGLGFIPLLVAVGTSVWPYLGITAGRPDWTVIFSTYFSGLPLLVPMLHLWWARPARHRPVPQPERVI